MCFLAHLRPRTPWQYCCASADSCFVSVIPRAAVQLRVLFSSVVCAKPKSSRNSSIGEHTHTHKHVCTQACTMTLCIAHRCASSRGNLAVGECIYSVFFSFIIICIAVSCDYGIRPAVAPGHCARSALTPGRYRYSALCVRVDTYSVSLPILAPTKGYHERIKFSQRPTTSGVCRAHFAPPNGRKKLQALVR